MIKVGATEYNLSKVFSIRVQRLKTQIPQNSPSKIPQNSHWHKVKQKIILNAWWLLIHKTKTSNNFFCFYLHIYVYMNGTMHRYNRGQLAIDIRKMTLEIATSIMLYIRTYSLISKVSMISSI